MYCPRLLPELVLLDLYFGSIEAGKAADLVLVESNSLEDISAFRKLVWITKGDKKYSAAKLFSSTGIKPFTEE